MAKFLGKRGEGIHHVCFAVEDLEAALADLAGKGFRLIHSSPVPGADGKRVAFLHPEAGARRVDRALGDRRKGPAMKIGEYVLVHLVNPREKFWGLLKDRDGSGLTVRGLSLEGFEGWLHEISRRETVTVLPATVFFPLHRVERIFLDETAGDFVSFADRFKRTVGEDARYYLTPDAGGDAVGRLRRGGLRRPGLQRDVLDEEVGGGDLAVDELARLLGRHLEPARRLARRRRQDDLDRDLRRRGSPDRTGRARWR